MDDIIFMLTGRTSSNEIMNLWNEIFFLRSVLSQIIESHEDIKKSMKEEVFEKARSYAKSELHIRFPNIPFNDKSQEHQKEDKNE